MSICTYTHLIPYECNFGFNHLDEFVTGYKSINKSHGSVKLRALKPSNMDSLKK